MRKRIAGATVALLLAAVPVAAPPAGADAVHAAPVAAVAKSCPSNFVRATIGGAVKCLHAGEFCAKRYQRQYRRYGFTCRANGRLRSS
jgi:hypothetical protein